MCVNVLFNLNLKLCGGQCLAEAYSTPLKQEYMTDVEGEAQRANPTEETPCIRCTSDFIMRLLKCSLMAI